MAWKLQKDKLQADPAKEEADQATGKVTSDAFSFSDTAVKEPTFAPDESEPTAYAPQIQTPAETAITHTAPEEPYFSTPPPLFTEPETAPEFVSELANEPAAFSPFVPYQPDKPVIPSFLDRDRDEVAAGLVSPGAEDSIPRVAPFIVDLPPVVEEPTKLGRLVIRIGNLSANFPLTKEVTTVGRPDSLAQSYPDVEIELDDAVSRRHAEIRRKDNEYYLVDLMSTNGTMLNGQRVMGDQEQLLLHGDRIRIGDRTEIVFE